MSCFLTSPIGINIPPNMEENGNYVSIDTGAKERNSKRTGEVVKKGNNDNGMSKKRYLWDKDGIDGGKSSLSVLLEWLTTEGNYRKWKGGDKQSGKTKETICSEIVAIMKDNGLHHRKNMNIRDKIQLLENQYKDATDWLNNTLYLLSLMY